jgi:DNA-binding transcriptional LysR family regulator
MNLSQLRAFIAVVEHNSFSSAARALGVSQPAVTMQVQGLESDVGATLLDRYYRKVELTEAGRTLLPFARDILSTLEEAQIAVDALSGRVTGRLAMAASTTPGQYILPRLLGEFIRENPEVGIELAVHDTSDVVAMVEEGRADLGLTGAHLPGTRVGFEELGKDTLVMIGPTDSDLASKRKVKLEDLVEEPFIMREQGSGTRIVMEETLKAGGIDPAELRIVTELGSSEAIVTAVEGGMGLGVVSRWMAEKALQLGTVAEIKAAHFPSERPFYLVMPKGTLTRAAGAFVEFLREKL